MLPKSHRLLADKDFARLFSKGRGVTERGITLKYLASGLAVTRVGFVVSTKVAKRAVVRNVIKRRMREVFRDLIPKVRTGVDIVLIARGEATKYLYADFVSAIDALLKKARLYRE